MSHNTFATLFAILTTIFVVLIVVHVGLKQLDRTLEGAKGCFPPYFLMKAEWQRCPTVSGLPADDEGVRSLGLSDRPNIWYLVHREVS